MIHDYRVAKYLRPVWQNKADFIIVAGINDGFANQDISDDHPVVMFVRSKFWLGPAIGISIANLPGPLGDREFVGLCIALRGYF